MSILQSQRNIATRSTSMDAELTLYYIFTAKFDRERILVIDQYLAKLWAKNVMAPFFCTRCIYQSLQNFLV